MSVGARALTTWTLFKLQFPDVSDADQASYERLIDQASDRVESETGRALRYRTSTWILDGQGINSLVLPEYPITSVTLYIDSSRVFSTPEDPSTYYLDQKTAILQLFGNPFPRGTRNVKIVAVHGFYVADPGDTPPVGAFLIPDDLNMAVNETTMWLRKRQQNGGAQIGLKSMVDPGGILSTLETTLPWNAKQVFEKYSRQGVF